MTAVWIEDEARDRVRRLVLAEAQRLADTSTSTLQLLEGLAELRAKVRQRTEYVERQAAELTRATAC